MENASKAITIAGSILMGIIVISLLVLSFNSLKGFKNTEQDSDEINKLAEFNKQYEVYQRNLYGTELFSLANKMISYNEQETLKESGYENVHLKIKLDNNLNDTQKYFKKKNEIKPDAHDEYYSEEEWVANFNDLNNKLNEIAKFSCTVHYTDEKGKTSEVTRSVKELANMRTNEKTKLGFTDDKTVSDEKGHSYKIGDAVTIYNTYKSDLTKVKETPYKYEVDETEYYKTTGRIKNMTYSGKFK